MRSLARGLAVLPGFFFFAVGSVAAMARAFFAGTPSVASLRRVGESVWGGGSEFAARFLGEVFAAAFVRVDDLEGAGIPRLAYRIGVHKTGLMAQLGVALSLMQQERHKVRIAFWQSH